MSDAKVLEELHVELAGFKANRDLFQNNLQQCVGAIHATEIAIRKLEEKAKPDADHAEKEEQAKA